MEGTPEQPSLQRTVREHRSWGVLESIEEVFSDDAGHEVERIVRDPAGMLMSRVRYVRDGDGRLMTEEWEELQEDGRVVRGRYTYRYDTAGRQIDKIWQAQ